MKNKSDRKNESKDNQDILETLEKSLSTDFPNAWKIDKGELKEKLRLPPNGLTIRFILRILHFKLHSNENEIENRIVKIKEWFVNKPKISGDLRNDLFFGLGYILIDQYIYSEDIQSKLYNFLPNADNSNPDYIFYKSFEKTIELFNADDDKWRNEYLKNLEELKNEFFEKSLLNILDIQKDVAQHYFGQYIKPGKQSQRKFSKTSEKIMEYLLNELAISDICYIDAKYKEKLGAMTNNQEAARLLKELAKLFTLTLPANLRKLDSK
jgi:hypothetical protein